MTTEQNLCDKCFKPANDVWEVNDEYLCEDCYQGAVAGAEAKYDAIRRGE